MFQDQNVLVEVIVSVKVLSGKEFSIFKKQKGGLCG